MTGNTRTHALLALLCASCLFVACPEAQDTKEEKGPDPTASTDKPQGLTTTPATKTGDVPPPKIEAPPGTGPVAKVNETGIARDAFNREYIQTLGRYMRARHDVPPELKERLKDNIVRRLVDGEIIRQQAAKMSIQIADAEREEKWTKHKKRYGSEEQFKAFLERAGTSADDVRRQFETNLVREKVFARVAESLEVTAAEAKEFYEKDRSRYDEPEQTKASHILIRLARGSDAAKKAELKTKAEMVAKKAKKKGADFAALAKEFGEDPTKDRGGDLGFFTKGRMVKPFEEAVAKLKKGQVSGVVETQFGFHIIKKTDHKPARKKPFAEAKEQIMRSMKARKRNTAIRESLDKWKKEAKIEIFVKGDEAIIKSCPENTTAPSGFKPPTEGAKSIHPNALKLKKLMRPPSTSDKPVAPPPTNKPTSAPR